MRINRNSSRTLFARQRQRSSTWSFVIILGLITTVGYLSRHWLLEFLTINSPTHRLSLTQARAAFDNGDLDTTILISRRLLETTPDDADVLSLLVRALVYRSYTDYDRAFDRQTALQFTATAFDQYRSNTDIRAIHAYALQVNGRTDEGRRLALTAIERNPRNIVARLTLALVYASSGLFETALREADYATQIAEESESTWRMDAHRVRAITLGDLGRYQEAIEATWAAIRYNQRISPIYFEQALYAMQIGNNNVATAAYFQVITLDPTNAKAKLRLCEISISLREREAAESYCGEAVERAPAWADAWYQLGREYFLQGNMVEARKALNRCSTLQVLQNVAISDRRFECWYLQGQAAEMLGDCETLVPLYEEFKTMAASANIPQTWVYPPEGPPMCVN